MSFANPIFLWALATLAVPIGIHLLSRKEGRVVKIGSIRFLAETSTRQFKGIRLNEILLLALRSLLIVLLTLYLAGFQIKNFTRDDNKWIVLENDLKESTELTSLLDSLTDSGYEIHYLEEGFPKKKQASTSVDYRKLINQLSKFSNTNAIIFSHNYLRNFLGPVESLSPNIKWIALTPEGKNSTHSIIKDNHEVIIRKASSVENETAYETLVNNEFANSDSLLFTKPIRIGIKADPDFQLDRKIIIASIQAFNKVYPIFSIEEITDSTYTSEFDWTFNLSSKPLESSAKNQISVELKLGSSILEKITPTKWVITKRLSEETALDANFPIQLCKVLYGNSISTKVNTADQRTVSNNVAWIYDNNEGSSNTKIVTAQSFDVLLLLIVIGLLITERVISFVRKQ